MRNVWSALIITGILMVYWAFKFYFWFAKRMESKDPNKNGANYLASTGAENDPESNKLKFVAHGTFLFLILFVGGLLLTVFSVVFLFKER